MGRQHGLDDGPAYPQSIHFIHTHNGGTAGRADVHTQLGVRYFGVFLCQPDAAYHQFFCELFSIVVREAEAQPNFHERLQQVKDEGRATADKRRKLGNVRLVQNHRRADGAKEFQHEFFLFFIQGRIIQA